MFLHWWFNLSSYLTLLLALVAVIGDYVVNHTNIHMFQAIFDNTTHSIIGGLSWLVVCIRFKSTDSLRCILEIAACSLIASVIDLDHFFSARSFRLKDATSLKNRPPLHCSTFPLVTCALLLSISYILQAQTLKRIALIILTAFLSHHTRDATRRGYWVFPFGSTPPIPYGLYVVLTCLIPYFICYLVGFVTVTNYKVINSSVI